VRRAHPSFLPDGLELAEILALIPRDSALVAPVITSQGSAVLVVPAGMQSVSLKQVLWLDDFKEADLRALLLGPAEQTQMGGWLGAYFNARRDMAAWRSAIEATGHTLWNCLLGPIAECLAGLDVRHVLLMPQGRLALLPLHAAWRKVDGEPRYFLDDYTVTYVPSAYARHVSEQRLHDAARKARTLFALVNPTEDLPFTPTEGDLLASVFGDTQSTVLPGSYATPHAVKQGLASYLHFACHGFYNWGNAMQSGLVLAKGERLTLAQIIAQLDLDAARLITLSACETGITDVRESPDEYLGLPAGFLQAGAPAVVSTLWAVNDLSTMLLMSHFYELHLDGGQDIPEALRQAQTWLRDVSAGELTKRFRDEEEAALLGKARIPIERASEYFARFAQQDAADRPFDSPYYWAAFTFSGA
jgi:CHAT domain-containing protein